MPYIYKIVNDINDKIYVGKTLGTIEERFKQHCYDRIKQTAEKRPLYSAMNKYGIEHFKIELVEECSLEEVNDREIYWIKKLNSYHNGYNATLGGDGSQKVDYDKIIELWNKGYNNKKICKEMNIDTDTVKKALTIYGVSSEERKKKGQIDTSKKVIMLDKNTGEKLQIFSSTREAGRAVGAVNGTHIGEVCAGKRKTAFGYKWKFLEE